MKYDYMENLKDDIIIYIKDNNINIEEVDKEQLYDDLFIEDCITGNGSGSYTFNTMKAQEYVLQNYDILEDVINEFGINMNEHYNDWEYLDVSIRCYLLMNAISEVYEELQD